MVQPKDELNKNQSDETNEVLQIDSRTMSKSRKLLSYLLCGHGSSLTTGKLTSVNRDLSKNATVQLNKQTNETENHSYIMKFLIFLLGHELPTSDFFGSFVILVVADWMAFTAIYITYAHLPGLAVAVGFSADKAAFLISLCGVGNTLGRMGAGWISDQNWILPRNFKLLAIFVSTFPIFLFIWTSSYSTFLVLSVMFGSSSGSMVGVTPAHFVQLLGLGLLTPAFGLVTVFRGLAAIMGPPLAALLMERYEAPWLTVFLAGAFMAVGALLSIVGNWHNQRTLTRRTQSLYRIID